jgi:hypothetical protein
VTKLPSQAGDGAAEVTWPQGNLAVAQHRCRVMLAIMLLSHAGDGAVEVTWPRRNLDAE